MRKIFVTGIGTDVGKTVISAILVEALHGEYWKPIQCGETELPDKEIVRSLVSADCKIHPEALHLKHFMSPHAAAELEGKEISLENLTPPATHEPLIIEGAGGVCVPLNKKQLVVDLISALDAEVVLVSRNYLGSINHTLLSVEAIKQRGLKFLGIIFNGLLTPKTEDFIGDYCDVPIIGRVNEEKSFNREVVKRYALEIKDKL